MSKRKLDKTDIGEMQCWASSALHSGFPKVQVDSDHIIELCERALDNSRLTEENAKLREFVKKVSELDIETFRFETQGGDEDYIEYVCTDIVDDAVDLLAKLNQEGEE